MHPFLKRLFFSFIVYPLFIFSQNSSSPYSVLLLNDSPYELTAVVQSADGKVLGQQTIQPGEQAEWTTDLNPTYLDVPATPNVSLTPFTVLWKCPYQGYYSVCSNVSAGALARANGCLGMRYCVPKPEKKKSNKKN